MVITNNPIIRGLSPLIGNTPLFKINFTYRGSPRVLYAKAENLNMTGSIKDRICLNMLTAADRIVFQKDDGDASILCKTEKDGTETSTDSGIDMENDIIEDIRFEVRNRIIGSLEFSYLQDIEQGGDEFIAPAIAQSPEDSIRPGAGILWLVDLAQGNLDK